MSSLPAIAKSGSTVVSGGALNSPEPSPSKPITETLPGTAIWREASSSKAPSAMASHAKKSPSNSAPLSTSVAMALRPCDTRSSPSPTNGSWTSRPPAFIAAR